MPVWSGKLEHTVHSTNMGQVQASQVGDSRAEIRDDRLIDDDFI